jgi:hypothetical protein
MSNLTPQETFRRLRSLGFSAEQALAEMDGAADDSYEAAVANRRARMLPTDGADDMPTVRRKVAVTMPARSRRVVNRGPRMEYVAKAIPKGRKVTVAMGNNTDVYKYLVGLRGRAATIPQIAEATGIPAHSVESSVYRLVSVDKLVAKQPIKLVTKQSISA